MKIIYIDCNLIDIKTVYRDLFKLSMLSVRNVDTIIQVRTLHVCKHDPAYSTNSCIYNYVNKAISVYGGCVNMM